MNLARKTLATRTARAMVSRPASYNSTPGWSTQRVLTRHHRRYGDTPLHWAAERHGLAVCAALLEDGAPVDARSRLLGSRETPLHRLCAAGGADAAAAAPPHAGGGDRVDGGAPKPGEDNRTLAELAAMDLNFEVRRGRVSRPDWTAYAPKK